MSRPLKRLSAIQKQLEYWRAYGMSYDPFDDELMASGSFLGEDREALLREAKRLACNTSQAIVFHGPKGIGKTTLLRQLQARLAEEEQLVVVVVPTGRLTTPQQLLAHLGQAFDLQSEQLEPAEIEVCIKECLQDHEDSPRRLVILVDDADQLPEFTLASLLVMASYPDAYISVLLFAASEQGMLRAELQNEDVKRLAIEPFDAYALESYLRYRLELAGADRHFPFTDADIDSLLAQSEGIPERVDELAEAKLKAALNPNLSQPDTRPANRTPLLVSKLTEIRVSRIKISELQVPGFAVSAKTLPGFSWLRNLFTRFSLPPRSLAAAAGILIFLGGVWLLGDGSPEEQGSATATTGTEPPPRAEVKAVREEPAVDLQQPSLTEALPNQEWIDRALSLSPAAGKPASGAGLLASSQAPGKAKPDVAQAPAQAAVVEAVSQAESVERVELVEITVDQKYIDKARQALPADEMIILNSPAEAYTLQLLGSSSQSGMRDFVDKHEDMEILVFEEELNGKPWFVAVTGRYKTVEEARGGLAGMPQALRRLKPWPRQFSSVQEDIRTFRSR